MFKFLTRQEKKSQTIMEEMNRQPTGVRMVVTILEYLSKATPSTPAATGKRL